MNRIKTFKIFENSIESEIDINILSKKLHNFSWTNIKPEISYNTDQILDFNSIDGEKVMYRDNILSKGSSENSINIKFFNKNKTIEFELDKLEDIYKNLCDFLYEEYNLIPNYIFVKYFRSEAYYSDFEIIKSDWVKEDELLLKLHELSLSFYRY